MIPSLGDKAGRVTCTQVLESAGWRLDGKPGPTYSKFRSPDNTSVILASRDGWLDPKMPRDAPGSRGNVLALVRRMHNCSGPEANQRLEAIRQANQGTAPSHPTVQQVWDAALAPARGTPGWRYLTGERHIPEWVIEEAVACEVLREGKAGMVLAKHLDATGKICGAELRTPGKRPAFLAGGTKGVCVIGPPPGVPASGRVFVAEGIIDALAARALEAGWQGAEGTVYASTGGAFGLRTAAAISSLLPPGGAHLVAGVDRGEMGDTFAEQLRHVAAGARATYSRALPLHKDWAEDLAAVQAMVDHIKQDMGDPQFEVEAPDNAPDYVPPISGRP